MRPYPARFRVENRVTFRAPSAALRPFGPRRRRRATRWQQSSRTSAWRRAAQIQTLPRRVLSSGRRPCGRDRLANGYRGDRSVSVGPAQQPHLAARTHRCAERIELSWSRLTVLRVRQPHRRRCDQRPAAGRPKRNFRSSRRGRDSCVDAPESSQLARGEGDEQDKPG
jgi:hypothetical protein